jgi:hypothetical protein
MNEKRLLDGRSLSFKVRFFAGSIFSALLGFQPVLEG